MSMNSRTIFTAVALLGLAVAAPLSQAAPADRFLHVQVNDSGKDGENVNVNVPIALAEKVLPTIDKGPMHQGRVEVPHDALQGIDIRTIIDAVRTTPDSQIASVKQKDETVEVSKSGGNIVVHVQEAKAKGDNINVTVPIAVVDALFSGTRQDELDVAAALKALDNAGDTFLVTVENASEHIRIWIDSNNQPK
jgi:hypothetical protein